MFTKNYIAELEERYWKMFEDQAIGCKIEFIKSPIYRNNYGLVRDYMFFTGAGDNGDFLRNFMNMIGGNYEHTIDGKRVA
jgi:hypothetical protein